MASGSRGFVPVLHGATCERPDEIDTLAAAEAIAGVLDRLGFSTEIVGLGFDLGIVEQLAVRRPLAVFNLVDALKGDGRLAPMVPVVLDRLGLAYTGARPDAWFATLSKIATKLALQAHGLPTPLWSEDGFGLDPIAPVIVKPVYEHGSLGLDVGSVMPGALAARAVAKRALRWNTQHFAEAYIEGREFNLALMERNAGPELLPIAEMLFESWRAEDPRIVGYEAKWAPESPAFVGTPRRFGLETQEPALAGELARLARTSWRLFDLSGYARADFRVDATGKPFILEVNMNPCLSPDAGFAAAAAAAGLSYEAMVERIVNGARPVLQASA
jgi:D-alanine-D-alanine ligase